mgnify:CR=1 FL=1
MVRPMELRQLQYALQIAKSLNFSRAAENLHIAQPSLSQQIAKLEKELGVLLFQRNTNAVELTYAGAVFVEKAQKIMDMIEQLIREMHDISQIRKGRLIVGSLPITGSHILPLVLPEFKRRYPDIEIVLVEETTAVLESLTSSGQTDVCLLTLPIADPTLTWQELVEEEIWLAVPPAHPLIERSGRREAVRIADLKGEPFIVLKRGQGFRKITFDLCKNAGFEPKIVFESTNIETVQSLVAAGMGIALVPKMVARAREAEFSPAYVRLVERPTRTLVIAYRKGRYLSKAAEAFITVMSGVLGGKGANG